MDSNRREGRLYLQEDNTHAHHQMIHIHDHFAAASIQSFAQPAFNTGTSADPFIDSVPVAVNHEVVETSLKDDHTLNPAYKVRSGVNINRQLNSNSDFQGDKLCSSNIDRAQNIISTLNHLSSPKLKISDVYQQLIEINNQRNKAYYNEESLLVEAREERVLSDQSIKSELDEDNKYGCNGTSNQLQQEAVIAENIQESQVQAVFMFNPLNENSYVNSLVNSELLQRQYYHTFNPATNRQLAENAQYKNLLGEKRLNSESENDSSIQNKMAEEENNMDEMKSKLPMFGCSKCSTFFTSKRGLDAHARECSVAAGAGAGAAGTAGKGARYGCEYCPYKGQSPAVLRTHQRVHSGEKPFSCSFCSYKSGQKNNVAKHMLIHMKQKPFKCQYCDYSCAQKNNLIVHERTHTGVKPFACTLCDYKTVQKPNLVKHLYLHTDQKPFACEFCDYKCVQKTNLTKHMQRHINGENGRKAKKDKVKTEDYPSDYIVCSFCPYQCPNLQMFGVHIQESHPEHIDRSQQLGGTPSQHPTADAGNLPSTPEPSQSLLLEKPLEVAFQQSQGFSKKEYAHNLSLKKNDFVVQSRDSLANSP